MISKADIAFINGFVKAAGASVTPELQARVAESVSHPMTRTVPTVSAPAPAPTPKAPAMLPVPQKVLNTERMQESGNSTNWGILGDKGKALGPLQIHEDNYTDAVETNPALAVHPYSYVTNLPFANKIFQAYQNRYNKPSLQALQSNPGNTNALKDIFATWHGGPGKYSTPGTTDYVTETLKKYLKQK